MKLIREHIEFKRGRKITDSLGIGRVVILNNIIDLLEIMENEIPEIIKFDLKEYLNDKNKYMALVYYINTNNNPILIIKDWLKSNAPNWSLIDFAKLSYISTEGTRKNKADSWNIIILQYTKKY